MLKEIRDRLVPFSHHMIHSEALRPFLELKKIAAEQKIDLAICSAYRSFEAQLLIWNDKVLGKRDVLDRDNNPIDIKTLNEEELYRTLIIWSAIPGSSRHHFGSDIDVIDAHVSGSFKLLTSEYEKGGLFEKLGLFLDEVLPHLGFDRPYQKLRKGVSPEPWHLSYRPVSERLLQQISLQEFQKKIQNSDILLKDIILDHSEKYWKDFVLDVF